MGGYEDGYAGSNQRDVIKSDHQKAINWIEAEKINIKLEKEKIEEHNKKLVWLEGRLKQAEQNLAQFN